MRAWTSRWGKLSAFGSHTRRTFDANDARVTGSRQRSADGDAFGDRRGRGAGPAFLCVPAGGRGGRPFAHRTVHAPRRGVANARRWSGQRTSTRRTAADGGRSGSDPARADDVHRAPSGGLAPGDSAVGTAQPGTP